MPSCTSCRRHVMLPALPRRKSPPMLSYLREQACLYGEEEIKDYYMGHTTWLPAQQRANGHQSVGQICVHACVRHTGRCGVKVALFMLNLCNYVIYICYIHVQAFIPDARDALREVNVLKDDTISQVEKEMHMSKTQENKSSPR